MNCRQENDQRNKLMLGRMYSSQFSSLNPRSGVLQAPYGGQHVCQICQKAFKFHKALCGHMRIHGPSTKDSLVEKVNLVVDDDRSSVEGASVGNNRIQQSCSLSGKNFTSRNKRCYPEIQRKEIRQDPDAAEVAQSGIDHNVEQSDFKKSVSCLSVIGRRGQIPEEEEEEKKKLDNAVDCLMTLAHHPLWNKDASNHEETIRVLEELPSKLVDSTGFGETSRKRGTFQERLTSTLENGSMELERENSDFKILSRPENNKKMKLMKYNCSSCNKSFSTHQALGGHKSSHTKYKIRYQSKEAANNLMTAEERDESTTRSHQCKKCKKIFPTGLELGGHMRFHRNGDASKTAERKIAIGRFDLNELPVSEEEEEKDDSGNC